jgi:alpha-amylase/alpha-mannosidase (GH57 family)
MARLNVALMWHMHQPCYREPDNRVFRLPWVRLHALKDYYDMAALAAQYPGISLTFNLVPVLVEQLEDYAAGRCSDHHLEASRKPVSDLTPEDKAFILKDFFMAHWGNMVEPYPRYRELLERRGRPADPAGLARAAQKFSPQDFRDLQVWFNLCWTDPWHIKSDPALARLLSKGRNFTEEDKLQLWSSQQAVLSSIIPLYRRLWREGLIEVSTTPYYHPILPLLCDSDAARESMPGAQLPPRFAFPQDAGDQILKALDYMEGVFGQRPAGMWPSEGSVSGQAVELMARAGLRWTASDEGILERSLGQPLRRGQELERPDLLYQPYQVGGINVFFRDRAISDKMGFDYYNWDPLQAADDLVSRLETAAVGLGGSAGDRVVPIILDGENVWEFFPDDGHAFLNRLYLKLSESPRLRCQTFSRYLEGGPPAGRLAKIFPGSWINSDFRIWIGSGDNNCAWELLLRTRQAVEAERARLEADSGLRQRVMEHIQAAEGSDWFWWFGGNFSSENLAEFDGLFREHLRSVYRLLGREAPERLFSPVLRAGSDRSPGAEPLSLISPRLDGMVSWFYEWSGSGLYDIQSEGGAMKRSRQFFRRLHFGFDRRFLYLRLDPSPSARLSDLSRPCLVIDVLKPGRRSLSFELAPGAAPDGCGLGVGRIIELGIPYESLGAGPGDEIEIQAVLKTAGEEMEKHPDGFPLGIRLPDGDFEARNWQA